MVSVKFPCPLNHILHDFREGGAIYALKFSMNHFREGGAWTYTPFLPDLAENKLLNNMLYGTEILVTLSV